MFPDTVFTGIADTIFEIIENHAKIGEGLKERKNTRKIVLVYTTIGIILIVTIISVGRFMDIRNREYETEFEMSSKEEPCRSQKTEEAEKTEKAQEAEATPGIENEEEEPAKVEYEDVEELAVLTKEEAINIVFDYIRPDRETVRDLELSGQDGSTRLQYTWVDTWHDSSVMVLFEQGFTVNSKNELYVHFTFCADLYDSGGYYTRTEIFQEFAVDMKSGYIIEKREYNDFSWKCSEEYTKHILEILTDEEAINIVFDYIRPDRETVRDLELSGQDGSMSLRYTWVDIYEDSSVKELVNNGFAYNSNEGMYALYVLGSQLYDSEGNYIRTETFQGYAVNMKSGYVIVEREYNDITATWEYSEEYSKYILEISESD